MTAAERRALIEQRLADARAKIAAGLVAAAQVIDPTVTVPATTPEGE